MTFTTQFRPRLFQQSGHDSYVFIPSLGAATLPCAWSSMEVDIEASKLYRYATEYMLESTLCTLNSEKFLVFNITLVSNRDLN